MACVMCWYQQGYKQVHPLQHVVLETAKLELSWKSWPSQYFCTALKASYLTNKDL